MHLCANNKGIVSAEVFLTILEVHPDFPLEIPDMYGNTRKFRESGNYCKNFI